MTAIRQLRESCARVWDSIGGETIASVIEKHYKLSPATEGDPGSYDVENNPYWRKVMNCCDDPLVRKVTVLKSTQVGGTILTQGIILACAVVDPAPCMYVLPTRDEFATQRNRLYGNALVSNDPIRRLVPPKSKWSMEVVNLGGMNVNAAWAGSPQRLRGKPCKRVFKSEADVMKFKGDEGNPHKSADERTKQFEFDKLIFDESTPVGDDSYIYNEFEKSNKERWMVKCPCCGCRQELQFFPAKSGKHAGCGGFAGYRAPDITVNGSTVRGELLEPEEAKRKAYYICKQGCRIEQEMKNWMIKSGEWCPAGQWIEDIPLTGPWQQGQIPETLPVLRGEPKRARTHSGFHIWTVMQSKISIGKIAAAYINHSNDGKLRDFFQNWLGFRFRVGHRTPPWDIISKKYTRNFTSGTVPDKCWFLTAAADVQEDQVYWMVVGWAPLRTPYLIGWGEIFKDESDADDELSDGIVLASDVKMLVPALMQRRWPVNGVNPRGKTQLPVRLAGVDSNYRTAEVHDLIRSFNDENRLRCLRGDDSVGSSGVNFRRAVIEKNTRTGETYEDGGLVQWQLYKNYYQDNIAQRLLSAPNQPGALHLPEDILPNGKKLLKQTCNVRKDENGYYKQIDGTIKKDYRDLWGYCEAMADMVVGKAGWTEKAWLQDAKDRTRAAATAAKAQEIRDANDIGEDSYA